MAHRYDDVKISVRSTADESSVAFGVVIGEAFLPFHWMPTGGFEDDLATVAQDAHQFAGPPAEPPKP
jgi:hypothetical protein